MYILLKHSLFKIVKLKNAEKDFDSPAYIDRKKRKR